MEGAKVPWTLLARRVYKDVVTEFAAYMRGTLGSSSPMPGIVNEGLNTLLTPQHGLNAACCIQGKKTLGLFATDARGPFGLGQRRRLLAGRQAGLQSHAY
jgi:hypothetical protein